MEFSTPGFWGEDDGWKHFGGDVASKQSKCDIDKILKSPADKFSLRA